MKKTKKRKGKNKSVIWVILILFVCCGLLGWQLGLFDKKIISLESNLMKVKEDKINIIDVNSDTRSIAVMINNHDRARPYHIGLQDAYIIYEIIVEGGYTRYMALYKDINDISIGSIRSSRHYFLDYAMENDAIYVHWGWSDKARQDIDSLGINNINGIFTESKYFYRNKDLPVAFEHTGFTNMNLIKRGINDYNYRTTTTKDILLNYVSDSVDMKNIEGNEIANEISLTYSSMVTNNFTYNKNDGVYYWFVNGEPHVDYNSKKQYSFKNIITYQVSNYTLSGDVKGRQDIDNIGTGNGFYISDGYAVPIKWSKSSRTSQTVYNYLNGREIDVNDGNTIIQIQPKGMKYSIS